MLVVDIGFIIKLLDGERANTNFQILTFRQSKNPEYRNPVRVYISLPATRSDSLENLRISVRCAFKNVQPEAVRINHIVSDEAEFTAHKAAAARWRKIRKLSRENSLLGHSEMWFRYRGVYSVFNSV